MFWLPRLLSLGLLAMTASASVTVRKTGQAPTGYEVDFKYVDKTAKGVRLSGGIGLFTDPFRTSFLKSDNLAPSEYKPGYFMTTAFPGAVGVDWPYEMKATDDGVWTLTTPLPSGTFFYSYEVDCDTCDPPKKVVFDPDLPPLQNVPGDQVVSSFQVPFDPMFQVGEPLVNFDYALEAPEGKRGTIQPVNYTSPGSIWPAPDVHDFIIYQPAGYGKEPGKKYPLLYLVHGATSNAADFPSKLRVQHVLDNLIATGNMEPTVVVFPNYYNLDGSHPFAPGDISGSLTVPGCADARKHFQDVLFPLIEDTYDVCDESWCRAFAGLSLGGSVTYEMWTNATDYFDYYGYFSMVGFYPSPYGNADDFIRQKPSAAQKGIFLGYGLYDQLSFNTGQDFARYLDFTNTQYVTRITPFGEHFHPTWQDHLWWFGSKTLWKPIAKQTGVASG